MSQEDIFNIIKKANGQKLIAQDIINKLIAEGKQINVQSFYSAIKKVEKDSSIKTERKLMIRYGLGSQSKFYKKRWFYESSEEQS